ncbi:response regulator [Pseudoalteromonas sp. MMG010]|uniref:response regulator n=1 Tax=Pseudoalteromonas sp. MMG010 TaxID=2822685 RepID=UPI001B39CE1E|nr:response regulator [Pseudoalteromonas sp. MMG010]MBQ4832416.1 response regulator [Pseudoalteromonas sp. MMG010]
MEFVRPLEPILIIDDVKESYDELNTILTNQGFENIFECCDVSQVKSTIHSKLPKVIFLDIDLPSTHCDEIIAYVNEHFPTVFIVMCSGHNSLEVVQNSWEIVAKEFLEKPFNAKKVDTVMKRLELT